MVIKIASLVIDINLIYEKEFRSIYDYKYDSNIIDASINSTFDEYKNELINPISETTFYDKYKIGNKIIQHQKNQDGKYYAIIEYDDKNITIYNDKNNTFIDEYLLSQYAINYLVSNYTDSIFFHSSSIKYENLGIAFSAKSGTGKSTHRRLWEKYGNAKVINDDKNIITLKDDELYITPNPWCGKHMRQNNIESKLNAVVFLFQSKENVVVDISKSKAFKLLLGQIIPPNDDNLEKWNKIVDKLLMLPIYYYGCNMEEEAFSVIKERILKDYANK